MIRDTYKRWAPRVRTVNQLDGDRSYLEIWDGGQMRTFLTRRACQAYIKEYWGYLAERPDLRKEPHGWRMPQAVRVTITVTDDDFAPLPRDRL